MPNDSMILTEAGLPICDWRCSLTFSWLIWMLTPLCSLGFSGHKEPRPACWVPPKTSLCTLTPRVWHLCLLLEGNVMRLLFYISKSFVVVYTLCPNSFQTVCPLVLKGRHWVLKILLPNSSVNVEYQNPVKHDRGRLKVRGKATRQHCQTLFLFTVITSRVMQVMRRTRGLHPRFLMLFYRTLCSLSDFSNWCTHV